MIFDTPRRYDYPEVRAAGERTFSTLLEHIEECQAAGELPQDNVRLLGLIYLATVQGTAKLAITGRLPFSGIAEVCEFYDRAASALTTGLTQGAAQSPATRKLRVKS